jgi:pantothenate kinase
MADRIESTVEEPLAYFQYMFSGTGFIQLKHKILSVYEDMPDYIKDGDKISFTIVVGDGNNDPLEVTKTIDFELELKNELSSEFNTFILNLDKALDSIAIQDKSPVSFLSRLQEKATKILLTSKSKTKFLTAIFEPVIKDYPFIESEVILTFCFV